MNIKDMQFLIALVSQTEETIASVAESSYPSALKSVMLEALHKHKRALIAEFEARHNINLEV